MNILNKKTTLGDICLHMCSINENHMIYGFLDEKCDRQNFGPFFAFYLFSNLKNQHFEKMKKVARDIIILHLGNTNDNYMTYGSWDMGHSRQNFLLIGLRFAQELSLKKLFRFLFMFSTSFTSLSYLLLFPLLIIFNSVHVF